jgi:hypothetical protein
MMRKEIFVFGIMFLLVLALGCTGSGDIAINETKLEANEGLGIVGSIKIDELNPGLDGYVSLTVRNNVGGEDARDIYVSLDNVKPFKIVECAGSNLPNTERSADCVGIYNLDNSLPYRSHGTTKMFPGEEAEFYWRLQAPSADEISDISLKHPLYYDLEYGYKTSLTQNIIFMSQQELLRRRQSGEEYQVSGEAKNSNGELRINGNTQQPILYFFSGSATEQNFAFSLQYHVENIGKGIPRSDVVMLFELPPTGGIIPDNSTQEGKVVMENYGWHKWNEWDGQIDFITSKDITPYSTCTPNGTNHFKCDCRTGRTNPGDPKVEYLQNCSTWTVNTYGGTEEFNTRFKKAADEGRLIAKVVKREDFVDSFDLYVPLILTSKQMQDLKSGNIPIQLSTFKVHSMYRYFIEGKDYITVFPIRI